MATVSVGKPIFLSSAQAVALLALLALLLWEALELDAPVVQMLIQNG